MFPASCLEVAAVPLAGKDQPSRLIIKRLNAIDSLWCDIKKRIATASKALGKYCSSSSSSAEPSSSSSSSTCPVPPCKSYSPGPSYAFLIDVNDLDEDVYDSMSLLEQEGCAILRKLILFEKNNIICGPSTSSSSGGETSPCSQTINSGGEGITEIFINLGSDTGTVTLAYNAYAVPDKFVVEWNGSEVINTGYRGDADEDDEIFEATGEHVVGPGAGVATFNKSLSFPATAKITITAPIEGTVWDFTLYCPGETPPSVSSSSSSESLPSSSSSSSASPEPSSSSSSSASPFCPTTVYIASYCEDLEITGQLYTRPDPGILYGPCAWGSFIYSSSSSSASPTEVILRYRISTSTWELWRSDLNVFAKKVSGDPYGPQGTYIFEAGDCFGEAVFII